MAPHITLEQWNTLVAVVEAGGYAQAAQQLHKTQSTVTYAIQKLESLLEVEIFRIEGRKARLTPVGQVLYQRAKSLVEEAGALEHASRHLAAGWEPEVKVAAEIVFPTWLLLRAFERFAAEQPLIRLQLFETVLGGTEEALLERKVDFAITSRLISGTVGDPLLQERFIAAAHPDHPLHQLGRPLTLQDLRKHRQLVIRDSAVTKVWETPIWLGAEQRWTVSHKATAIAAACMGLGFAWFPEHTIQTELATGLLKPLPLREGSERFGTLYLIFKDRDYAGPGALRLAEIIRETLTQQCTGAGVQPPGNIPDSSCN
ncbi:MAG TPA: LysR family transcriptional regulator [Moraxellaceae bacterium]